MSYTIRRNTIKPELFEHNRSRHSSRSYKNDIFTPEHRHSHSHSHSHYSHTPYVSHNQHGGEPSTDDAVEDVVSTSVCSFYNAFVKKNFKVFIIVVIIIVVLVRQYIQTAKLKRDQFNPTQSIKHQKRNTQYQPDKMYLNLGTKPTMQQYNGTIPDYNNMMPYKYDHNKVYTEPSRMSYVNGLTNPYQQPSYPSVQNPLYHNSFDYGQNTNNFVQYTTDLNKENITNYDDLIANNSFMLENIGPFGIDNVGDIDPPYAMCNSKPM